MKYKKLLVLLLINSNPYFLHAAQESKIQDEPFDQLVESTVEEYPGINQTFTFLQEQGLVNQSFRQFLQTKLASDEDENDKRNANFGEIIEQAKNVISINMEDKFLSILSTAIKTKKTLGKFHGPIFLYMMKHKDNSMHDMIHDWLHKWSNTKDNNGSTPLHLATSKNNPEVASLLITAGVNLNFQDKCGHTPLHLAISGNNQEIASLLIIAKANLNLENKSGYTSLQWSVVVNCPKITCLLIDAHANLNIQNSLRETPLHMAAIVNSIKIARVLINASANLNLQDKWGYTPLHTATIGGCSKIAGLLINAGADLTIQNNNGLTAEQVASTPEMQIIFMRTRIQKALSCTIS